MSNKYETMVDAIKHVRMYGLILPSDGTIVWQPPGDVQISYITKDCMEGTMTAKQYNEKDYPWVVK